MASDEQTYVQMPQPMQRLASGTTRSPSMRKAAIQHLSMQAPHPEQASSSIVITQLATTAWLGDGVRLIPLNMKQ